MTRSKPKQKTRGKDLNQAGEQAPEQSREQAPEQGREQAPVQSTKLAKDQLQAEGKELAEKLTLKKLPVYEIYPAEIFTNTSIKAVELDKINEIGQMLWVPASQSEEEQHARLVKAMELYHSLKPADGAEGMLATQMVGTHHAALECLRRAAISEQTFAGRDMALKHAQKLMSLYTKQLETLNKHRGKGQQKVTVEHVNVAAGGQAIVGNVDVGAKKQAEPPAEPKTGVKSAVIEQVE